MNSIWDSWKTHFETNAVRPLPEMAAPELTERQRFLIGKSLAIFHVGESGEGRIARDIDDAILPGVDDVYRQSLKLFVKEEGRHARILKSAVLSLGGTLLKHQWTDAAFVTLRRLLGIRFKLLVLNVAEVLGIAFYGLLSESLPAGPMKAALTQMCEDEASHLQFHAAFFRVQHERPMAAWLLRAAWWPVVTAASWLLIREHSAALDSLGVPRHVFRARLQSLSGEVAELMKPLPGALSSCGAGRTLPVP